MDVVKDAEVTATPPPLPSSTAPPDVAMVTAISRDSVYESGNSNTSDKKEAEAKQQQSYEKEVELRLENGAETTPATEDPLLTLKQEEDVVGT